MTEVLDAFRFSPLVATLAVALGCGLLIGAERERRKLEGSLPTAAGIRTFALAALAGALALTLGGAVLLATISIGLIGLVAISYWSTRTEDPGLTTELALVATLLVGGLSVERPEVAAGVSVVMAVLLASRDVLHDFVGRVMTRRELYDALILGAATLIVLPLLPATPFGDWDVISLRSIWLITIMVMAIGAMSHVANRLVGARAGSLAVGFIGGFASSTATIASMAAWSARHPHARRLAAGGALFSNISTMVLAALIVGAIEPALLVSLGPSLAAGTVAALAGSMLHARRILGKEAPAEPGKGPAFSVAKSLLFALSVAALLIISTQIKRFYGMEGLVAASALTGFADFHAATTSLAALANAGELAPPAAVWPVLAALSTNTLTKIVMAFSIGGRSFGWYVLPTLLLSVAAAWLPIVLDGI